MIYEMTTTQMAPLFVHPVDKQGNPREVENLRWESSSPEVATIESLDAAGKPTDIEADRKPWVVATGVKGQTEIKVTADRKIGEAIEDISESFTLGITDPEATSLGVGIGEPVEKG